MTQTIYPCPCCGYLVHDQEPGSYQICPICRWEDDLVQLRWPHYSGGANRQSLVDAQLCYRENGASSPNSISRARPPTESESRDPGFRPVDPSLDNFEAEKAYEADWPADRTSLYWWRPSYWRLTNR
ncbi:CPCC family cysteine-rich protein [Nonomuraea sp. NPDC050394]|uniref:CPCC family cysteine-rich protein n=1 Tax=Nonomuraea sp. NPDC050394 TaxID=3364363 RepID=UPI0037AECFA5